MKLNAKQLRGMQPEKVKELIDSGEAKIEKNEIYIILDDVLDTYNIGSIFRLGDALAVKKIYLCKGSETPPNHRIKKASVNTVEWIDWEYAADTVSVIKNLKFQIKNLSVVAVEQSEGSIAFDQFNYQFPIALVVGHESYGVSEEVLSLCDGVVELPMFGVNVSLNVMVSLGIVLYEVVRHRKE